MKRVKTKERKAKSSFFFTKTSFWTGIGSVFNIAGNYYEFNHSSNELEADRKAIQNDWETVGEDISDLFGS